mmetsp:Transcript_110905/g.247642  ORF Transcript_110905/g.247642 Transcript_110905/m.247642 type:complete len:348 (-) Transcript_110905:929-1972(-)
MGRRCEPGLSRAPSRLTGRTCWCDYPSGLPTGALGRSTKGTVLRSSYDYLGLLQLARPAPAPWIYNGATWTRMGASSGPSMVGRCGLGLRRARSRVLGTFSCGCPNGVPTGLCGRSTTGTVARSSGGSPWLLEPNLARLSTRAPTWQSRRIVSEAGAEAACVTDMALAPACLRQALRLGVHPRRRRPRRRRHRTGRRRRSGPTSSHHRSTGLTAIGLGPHHGARQDRHHFSLGTAEGLTAIPSTHRHHKVAGTGWPRRHRRRQCRRAMGMAIVHRRPGRLPRATVPRQAPAHMAILLRRPMGRHPEMHTLGIGLREIGRATDTVARKVVRKVAERMVDAQSRKITLS